MAALAWGPWDLSDAVPPVSLGQNQLSGGRLAQSVKRPVVFDLNFPMAQQDSPAGQTTYTPAVPASMQRLASSKFSDRIVGC